jgi:hypothetical protein
MATFYKYAERQAGDFVNWAEIGKNATDMISEEYKIRDEKKAAIDEEARQLFLKLAEPPTGVSDTAQKKAIEFSDVAQKQKLNDLRLLKSGKLNLKDYLVRSQNLSDGTGIAFNLIKEYQEEFKVKMDRMNSADPKTRSQAIEAYLMESVEGFGKLESMDFLVDPNQGVVQLGMKKMNPTTGVYEFTNDILPVVHARSRIRTKYDYFDSDAATSDIESKLGESVRVIRKFGSASRTGQVLSYEDKKELENYDNAEKLYIESYLSTPLNMSSVLTNDMKSQGYFVTDKKDEAAKNPKAIFLNTGSNGVVTPEFTDEQKEAAFEYMKTSLRGKIDRKEKSDMYSEQQRPRPTEPEIAAANTKKLELEGAGYWNEIAAAPTLVGKTIAAQKFLGTKGAIDAGLMGIDLESDPGRARLLFEKPEMNRTVSFYEGTLNDWADMNEFTTVTSREEKRRVGGEGRKVVDLGNSKDYKGAIIKRQGKPERPATPADPYTQAMSSITTDIFNNDDNTVAEKLSDIFGGLVAVTPTGIVNEVIELKIGNVKEEFKFKKDGSNAKTVINNMKNWVNKNKTPVDPSTTVAP